MAGQETRKVTPADAPQASAQQVDPADAANADASTPNASMMDMNTQLRLAQEAQDARNEQAKAEREARRQIVQSAIWRTSRARRPSPRRPSNLGADEQTSE